jgi:hypothetical protein
VLYDLPCGVQACLDGVGVVCMGAEEGWPVDIECDAGESTFEEGVCEADESGAVQCEDQRGESACESTTGCSWLPAACTYTDDCEAWSEPAAPTGGSSSSSSSSGSSSCEGLSGLALCLCVNSDNYGACSSYI